MNYDQHAVVSVETASFTTTQWGLVLAAGNTESPAAAQALAQLCQTYWYPLYAYVRHRGFDEHAAKDLTQGFFEQLLARNDLAKADPERGRFRSFLLKSLQHYIANEQRNARRLKRGGGQPVVALDDTTETRYRVEPFHELTQDKLYERRWAMAVISRALQRLRDDYAAADQTSLCQELEGALTGSSRGGRLAEIGQRLGLSESAVKVTTHRLRKRFGKMLREVILDTVPDVAEVDTELRHLQAILQEGLTTITLPSPPSNLSPPTG
jgi:RNA polymerase sigma-70 factor (ECF subfamily)